MIRANMEVLICTLECILCAISHYTTHALYYLYAPRTDHSHIPGYAVFVVV